MSSPWNSRPKPNPWPDLGAFSPMHHPYINRMGPNARPIRNMKYIQERRAQIPAQYAYQDKILESLDREEAAIVKAIKVAALQLGVLESLRDKAEPFSVEWLVLRDLCNTIWDDVLDFSCEE